MSDKTETPATPPAATTVTKPAAKPKQAKSANESRLEKKLAEAQAACKKAETDAGHAINERDELKRIQSVHPPSPPVVDKSRAWGFFKG